MTLVLNQLDFPSLGDAHRSVHPKRSKKSGKREALSNNSVQGIAVLWMPSPTLFTIAPRLEHSRNLLRGGSDQIDDISLIRSFPTPVDSANLRPGQIVWGKASVQRILEVHAKSRYGLQYERGDAQDYNTFPKTLLVEAAKPVAGNGWVPVRNGNRKKNPMANFSAMRLLGSADMTENSGYTKGERPMIILKANTPNIGEHLVLVLATFDGEGLCDSDKFTRSVSYPIKGSAAAHTWLDAQNGQMVPIKNTPLDLPIVRRYSGGNRCKQYLIALAVPFRGSSMVDMGDDVLVPLSQVESLTALMLRHSRFTEDERNALML